MRRHLVSHWWVWAAIVVVVVIINELVDRNFFDHQEHISGDFVLTLLALMIAFLVSYFVGRLRSHRPA